jgi:hypothetical protein
MSDDAQVICIYRSDTPQTPSLPEFCVSCDAEVWISVGMASMGKPICQGCVMVERRANDSLRCFDWQIEKMAEITGADPVAVRAELEAFGIEVVPDPRTN